MSMTQKKMTRSSQNKLISIGVDVGTVNGAIAIVDEDMQILLLTKAPTFQTELKHKRNKDKLNKETGKFERDYRKKSWLDFKEVGKLFKPYVGRRVIYTIERLIPRSDERESSSFTNGNSMGIFQGLYSLLEPVEYYEPLPITWKSDLGVTSDKETSVKLAENIYEIKLRDYLKRGKVDDIAEALLLAFYGFRQYFTTKGDK